MDYYILKGIILLFLIQHCTSEDVPSSIQSSSVVNLQDGAALTQKQEPSAPAEVVPVVAPPSLEEVQQAVQEASEQVEGRGAEEVLKGLLERVVEAALGQVETGEQGKVDDTAVVVEPAGDADSQAEELENEKSNVGEDVINEQEVMDASKDDIAAIEGNVESTIITVDDKTPNQEVVESFENTESNKGQTSELPEAPEMVVGEEPAQETTLDLAPGLAEVEQVDDDLQSLQPFGDRAEEVMPSDNMAQTVEDEQIEQVIDTNTLEDNEMLQAGGVEGNLVVQEVDMEQGEGVEEAEELSDGEKVIEGGSIVPKVEEAGSEAGEEEQIATDSSKDEDQEVLQIPEGASHEGAGGPIQPSPEQHAETPPPSPSQGGVEMGGSTQGDETAHHSNEITPTDDHTQAWPTLDNVMKDVLVLPPQLETEQLGEAKELVEDTTINRETSELGLEAWKIGAICAAVLLVVETVVIIIYILRNRNKKSSGHQRVCEEGSVEPDATTGEDYNDDTLPAGNGDTQQTAMLDPSIVASTLVQNKEEQELEQVIPMSELLPSSENDSPNNTAEPEPSPDLRTSAL